MCHRMEVLRYDELVGAMEQKERTGRASVAFGEGPAPEAYPGARVPLLVPDTAGALQVAALTWGFEAPRGKKLVFNTRLDTALSQLRAGRGLWARAVLEGRCLVPVRSFFETSRTQRRTDPATGRSLLQQYRFGMPGHQVFLLAGIAEGERFSVMTTEPNAVVGAVHTRMPLVLGAGESAAWLAGDFERLADRGGIALDRAEAQ